MLLTIWRYCCAFIFWRKLSIKSDVAKFNNFYVNWRMFSWKHLESSWSAFQTSPIFSKTSNGNRKAGSRVSGLSTSETETVRALDRSGRYTVLITFSDGSLPFNLNRISQRCQPDAEPTEVWATRPFCKVRASIRKLPITSEMMCKL